VQRPVLCCVTDRRRFHYTIDQLLDRIRLAAEAGVDLIQIRERDLPDAALVALVRSAVAVSRGTRARVLVNDRTDVAIAAGAAGVHLRGDSLAAPRVRSIAPDGFLIGRSVHSLDDVASAEEDGGCDYLLFGTVFASEGKPDGHPIAGIDALRAACKRASVPVLAIGGVDVPAAREIAATGAAGVAAIGLFMAPESAAEMRARVESVRRAFDTPFEGCLK
jgi:thiamine-phosphate pyrophosphorylase